MIPSATEEQRRYQMQSSQQKSEAARVQFLIEKLEAYPEVFARVERILEVVENETGEVRTADQAEEFLVQELRKLGHDALHGWAEKKEENLAREYGSRTEMVRREKKGSHGKRGLGQ
jgi:hypothetical protein